jgi:hypothetical protein
MRELGYEKVAFGYRTSDFDSHSDLGLISVLCRLVTMEIMGKTASRRSIPDA